MSLPDRFAARMAELAGTAAAGPFGVAVSGGGDSAALLELAADWAAARGVALCVATVDHGLRPGAAAEADAVAARAAALGLPHETLAWRWDGSGNLQDSARRGRLGLLAAWAGRHRLAGVLLGHTRDDVAETFLMRLARGAGVDGLAAMAARRRASGVLWLRPLLGESRAALREELRRRGLGWSEDPSNDDPRFGRARARAALVALAPLGIDAAALAATAGRLAEARQALCRAAAEAAARLAREGAAGELRIEAAGLAALPPETARRLLVGALTWVSSAEYPPRQHALAALRARIDAGRPGTLHGCRVSVGGGAITVLREGRAVAGLAAPAPGRWDGRWEIAAPPGAATRPGLEIRALGERGLAACPDWRTTGAARAALLAAPAVWAGERLVAAPLAGRPEGWSARLLRPFAATFTAD
ncbi:MAG: tRNA lysidine(34) synthetase TilS [Rhodobacteraceae bacterium]|nr:tRNA lysidine(34) synthetase TilS [Paracoccaceae bacterium]